MSRSENPGRSLRGCDADRVTPTGVQIPAVTKNKTPRPKPGRFLRRARDQHEEGFSHHALARDQLLGLAALLVEYEGGELLQRLARFVQRAAVRVHGGPL